MVSVPDKFEAKVSTIEESCDLTTLSVDDLISKLQAQEQKNFVRSDEGVEGAFHRRSTKKRKIFSLQLLQYDQSY